MRQAYGFLTLFFRILALTSVLNCSTLEAGTLITTGTLK
jgi:2-keto-4-pentenoate hydratase/2-oxohepta-3-ene-1,7-dioic acid hydratase in catechol pathway